MTDRTPSCPENSSPSTKQPHTLESLVALSSDGSQPDVSQPSGSPEPAHGESTGPISKTLSSPKPRTSRIKAGIGVAAAAVLIAGVGGIGGWALTSHTQQTAPAAPATTADPADDWEAWEREYDAQQKREERERKLAEKRAEDEAKREKQDFDRQYAEQKKAEAARQAQLAPTSATLETLLRTDRQLTEAKKQPGHASPELGSPEYDANQDAADALRSDLFYLRDQVAQREGLQAVFDTCRRAYGPDAAPPGAVLQPEGTVYMHTICQAFSGEPAPQW